MPQPANGAVGDQVAHLDPLRMVDDHEGFADQHLLFVTQLDQRHDVLGVERQRLLDQNMLAGLNRLCRPFDMLRGRQRDVDAVDFLGGEQFLIGAEGMARAEPVGQRAGFGQVAAGYRRQHAVLSLDDCGQKLLAADLGRRQNTPSEHQFSPCGLQAMRFAPNRWKSQSAPLFVILGLDPRIHAANSAEECNRAEFWIAATP